MAKILRTVLIDSLCPAEKAELLLDGNTSITGTNGIGKSSFLKLIPIFYGASPGRVVKADGNNKSFADWYLPHETSFIVFEYINGNGEACCAIMHRTAGSYAYRLVSGPWQSDMLYLDAEAGRLVPVAQLIQHISKQGRSCSPALPPRSYRRIIQYNTGSANLEGIDDPDQRKMIEQYRRTFSLAPKRKEFSGIDTVTMAMIDEGHSFDSIRDVMADILEQEHGNLDAVLGAIKHQPFQSLVRDIESFTLFENDLKAKIDRLDTFHEQHESKTAVLRRAKQQSLLLNAALTDELARVRALIDALDGERKKAEDRMQAERDVLAEEQGEAGAHRKEISEQVARIERSRTDYAQKDMDNLAALCGQAEGLSQQRSRKQGELDQLDSKGADVRLKYDRLISEVKDAVQALIDQESNQTKAKIDALDERRDKLREEADAGKKELEATHKLALAEIEERRDQAAKAVTQQQAEIDQLRRYSILPDDQNAVNSANQAIEAQRATCQQHSETAQQLDAQVTTLKSGLDALASERKGFERQRETLMADKDKQVAALNAGADTLLGYLRRHHPSWGENIARLVPESILLRDDLNPELSPAGDTQSSLYGVMLNLEALPTTTLVDTSEIQNAIGRIESQIQQVDTDLEGLQKRFRKLDDQIRDADRKAVQARQLLVRHNEELASRESLRTGIVERAGANYINHCEHIDAELKRLEARLAKATQERKDLKAEQGRQLFEYQTAADGALENLKEERKSVIDTSATAIKEHEERRDNDISGLKANLEVALSDAGIDNSVNRRLQREIDELKKKLEQIKNNLKLVDEYQRWKEDVLPRLDTLLTDQEQAETAVSAITRKQSVLTELYREHQQQYRQRSNALEEGHKQLNGDQAIAQRLIESLAGVEADPAAELVANLNVQDIEHEARLARSARDTVNKHARSLYADIINLYRNRGLQQSPHGATIDLIARDANKETGNFDMAWLVAANELKSQMEGFHRDQRSKLIMQAQSLSSGVSDSKHKLEDLHKSIMRLGKEATERAQAVSTAFPSIESVEFNVQSNIRDLDFWTDLEYYDQQYRRWHDMGDDLMPTPGFLEALGRVETRLRNQKLSTRIAECFTVQVQLLDQGNIKRATGNQEFNGISSEGLRKVILCMLFLSLFELLRKDADLQIVIPLDEILKLAAENYVSLVHSFNERGAVALAAFPGGAPELLSQFANCYALKATSRGIEVREYTNPVDDGLDALNDALSHSDRRGLPA
ncbi:MAG: ATP-binding protein [Halopseudomonas sp.]